MSLPTPRSEIVLELGADVYTNGPEWSLSDTAWDNAVCDQLADGCQYFDDNDINTILDLAYNLIYGNEWMGECMLVGTSMLSQLANDRLRWGNRRPGSGTGQNGINFYGVFPGGFDPIEDQITIFDPILKFSIWESRKVFVHEMAHAAGANSYDPDATIRQTAYTSTYQPMAQRLENECFS